MVQDMKHKPSKILLFITVNWEVEILKAMDFSPMIPPFPGQDASPYSVFGVHQGENVSFGKLLIKPIKYSTMPSIRLLIYLTLQQLFGFVGFKWSVSAGLNSPESRMHVYQSALFEYKCNKLQDLGD